MPRPQPSMVLPKKTWLKWTRPVKSVLDRASESNRWKSKKKDLIIVLHYTIATIKTKKNPTKKKLFSEDIYTFSPVSLIDVSVLPRHFKFSSLYTRGGLQKTSLATPIIWLSFFLSMPGQFSLYKLFWFLPFFPSCSLLLILISLLKCHISTHHLIMSDLGCQIH